MTDLKPPLPSLPVIIVVYASAILLQLLVTLLIQKHSLWTGVVINQGIILALAPILLIYFAKYSWRRLLPFPSLEPRIYLEAAILIIALSFVISYLMALNEYFLPLPCEYLERYQQILSSASFNQYLFKVAILCVLPAICEEIFFRGFCQQGIRYYLGTTPAVVITAALFAVAHGNLYHVHFYLLLGLFLGVLVEVTGSLLPAILCHFINNWLTLTNNYLGVSFPLRGEIGIFDILLLVVAGAVFLVVGHRLVRERKLKTQN